MINEMEYSTLIVKVTYVEYAVHQDKITVIFIGNFFFVENYCFL